MINNISTIFVTKRSAFQYLADRWQYTATFYSQYKKKKKKKKYKR